MSEILELIDDCQTIDVKSYVYYRALKDRTIIINELIDDSILERAVYPLIQMDNDGTGKPITIYISSLGGSEYFGMALIDVIERIKTPLTIIGVGVCMSMGALILCAGKSNPNVKRCCFRSTVGLLHAGSLGVSGDANQAKDYMKFADEYEKKISKEHLFRNTNITIKDYAKYARKERYMMADEMLEIEMVDEIL